MTPMHSYSINNIFVIFIYCCRIKLLVNKAKNSKFYIDNEKCALPHQVFKVQSYYLNKLFGHHKYH